MFMLKEEFKYITYYGRGEIENYWDKYKSAKIGLYNDIVSDENGKLSSTSRKWS